MGKVNRYRLESSKKLKRVHKKMLENLHVKNIKSNKETLYFTIEDSNDFERISKFLSERSVVIEKVKK